MLDKVSNFQKKYKERLHYENEEELKLFCLRNNGAPSACFKSK